MMAVFGGASLLLACLGLYGAVSYTANLRLREFDVRMALGTGASQICGLVLRHAEKLALRGCLAGLTVACPISRALESVLFGITNDDLISWLLAPALLLSVALLSSLGTAGKAAKTDPAGTLPVK